MSEHGLVPQKQNSVISLRMKKSGMTIIYLYKGLFKQRQQTPNGVTCAKVSKLKLDT